MSYLYISQKIIIILNRVKNLANICYYFEFDIPNLNTALIFWKEALKVNSGDQGSQIKSSTIQNWILFNWTYNVKMTLFFTKMDYFDTIHTIFDIFLL